MFMHLKQRIERISGASPCVSPCGGFRISNRELKDVASSDLTPRLATFRISNRELKVAIAGGVSSYILNALASQTEN